MTCLDEVHQTIGEIGHPPDITQFVLQVVADQAASTDDLIAIVREEPELSQKVLELSNSSVYQVPREITDVSQTVAYLGSNTLVRLVVALSTSPCFARTDIPHYNASEAWRHGLASGMAAQLLADHMGAAGPGVAFAAGILHNIGRLVLAPHSGEHAQEIEEAVEEHRCGFPKAERMVLGVDHAGAGGLLAERWHLPTNLWQTIRYHHNPEFSPHNDELTALVHVADVLVLQLGIGLDVEGLTAPVCVEALRRLHLHMDDLDHVRLQLLEELARSQDLLKLA